MSNFEQCTRCRHDFASCGHYDGQEECLCGNYTHPVDNSNMFSSFFTWKGRYSRKQYLCSVLFAVLLYCILLFAMLPTYGFFVKLTDSLLLSNFIYGALIALAPSYILLCGGIKRAHDMGVSSYWGWIPVLALWWTNFFLIALAIGCFVYLVKDRGMDGINEHGSNPAEPYEAQLYSEAGCPD